MSEDPTQAMRNPDMPAYGRVGPVDPTEDPVTKPAMRPAMPIGEAPTVVSATRVRADQAVSQGRTRTAFVWMGTLFSAIVLIFLLIFIVQNLDPIQISFLNLSGSLPAGVALR